MSTNGEQQAEQTLNVTGALSLMADLGKVSGVLAIFGYISVRWHFNRLGVPAMTPLSLAQYLSETLLFVVQTLFHLLLYGAGLLILVLLALSLWRLIGTFWPAIQTRLVTRLPLDAQRLSPRATGIILLSTLTLLALFLAHLAIHPSDLSVGPLVAQGRLRWYESKAVIAGWLYELVWLFLLASGLLIARHRDHVRRVGTSMELSWQLCPWLLIVTLIFMPMLFGAYLHPTRYPVAALASKTGNTSSTRCGILALESSNSTTLWSFDQGYGVFMKIPNSAIEQKALGPIRDLSRIAREPEGEEAKAFRTDCQRLTDHLKQSETSS